MKFPITLFVVCSCAWFAHAEIVTGPTEVLDRPYGKTLFTLDKDVKVVCAETDNHHARIAFVGVVKEDAFWGRDRIKKHEPIYGLDGERLGESVRQVDLPLGKLTRGTGEYAAAFTGYVAWTSIDRTSEVERSLEPLVDRKLHTLTLNELRPYLSQHGFEPGASVGALTTYVVHDSPVTGGGAAPARLALVFSANQFVAVIAHRDVQFIARSPVFVRDGYTLTYVEAVDKDTEKRIETRLVAAILANP